MNKINMNQLKWPVILVLAALLALRLATAQRPTSTTAADAPAAATRPAAPLRIYAWRDYGVAGVVPFVWAEHRNLHAAPRGQGYDDPRNPEAEAARVASLLLARGDGERVLFLDGVGQTSDGLFAGDPARVVSVGANVGPTRRWCERFFAALKARGVTALDFVVVDNEAGVGYWQLGDEANRARVLRELKTTRGFGDFKLPEALRDAEPEAFATSSRPLVTAYAALAERVKNRALTAAVYEPLTAVYPGTSASNFDAMATAAATADFNGWEREATPTLGFGTHSSPPLYNTVGNRIRGMGLAGEAALDQAYADDRATLAACLASGVPAAPWYASPRYGGTGAERWARALEADVRSGVRVMLLWGEPGDGPEQWSRADAATLAAVVPRLRQVADGQ